MPLLKHLYAGVAPEPVKHYPIPGGTLLAVRVHGPEDYLHMLGLCEAAGLLYGEAGEAAEDDRTGWDLFKDHAKGIHIGGKQGLTLWTGLAGSERDWPKDAFDATVIDIIDVTRQEALAVIEAYRQARGV
jgi:hypothetical protein